MARYKLKNSNNTVNCEILNESAGDYIVRFKNGVIQNVPKNRVSQLDKIDEGVLDAVRGAAETVNKYGRKFTSKIKDIAKNVKNFILNAFVIDNTIYFNDGNNLINANHPVNILAAAANNKSVNFYPSDTVKEVCSDFGLKEEIVEHFDFYGDEYEGPFIEPNYNTNESFKPHKSLLMTLLEAENEVEVDVIQKPYLGPGDGIMLSGTKFCDDADTQEIVNELIERYITLTQGSIDKDRDIPGYLIFGAPGVGKSAIVASLKGILKKEGYDISVISVNGSTIGPEDFSFPTITENGDLIGRLEKLMTSRDKVKSNVISFFAKNSKRVCDLNKSWLPFYDGTERDSSILEWSKVIANGGKVDIDDDGNVTVEEGDGGIFFIDEFTRLTPDGINTILNLPVGRQINANLVLGDKWIVVAAANRYTDLSEDTKSLSICWEAASSGRFQVVNYVPKPEEWLYWARQKGKDGYDNVINEIRDYIESEVNNENNSLENNWGDYYNTWSYKLDSDSDVDQNHAGKQIDRTKPNATPRTWTLLSNKILSRYINNPIWKGILLKDYPEPELIKMAGSIVGKPVAERFAKFVLSDQKFTLADAKNIILNGVNSSNINNFEILQEKYSNNRLPKFFTDSVLPKFKEDTPEITSGAQLLHMLEFVNAFSTINKKFNRPVAIKVITSLVGKSGYDIKQSFYQTYAQDEDVNKSYILRIIWTSDDFADYFNPKGSLNDGFTTEEFEEAYKKSSTKNAQDIINIIIANKTNNK